MSDLATRLKEHVDAAAPPVDVESLVEQLQQEPLRTPRPLRHRVPNWTYAVAAAVIVILLGLIPILFGAGDEVVDEAPTPLTVIPTVIDQSIEGWDPILSETVANQAPPAADCPGSTDPDTPGPIGQERPRARFTTNLAAVFDLHRGRTVYVDVMANTWTFDVCTNTWAALDPTGQPAPSEALFDRAGQPSGVLGSLVYDVDSDLVVMWTYEGVSVYDPTTNRWEQRSIPTTTRGGTFPQYGAVYDPVSGLIVTSTPHGYPTDDWGLWVYDVDDDSWTELGVVDFDRDTGCCTGLDLLGYSAQLDRLILTTWIDEGPATLLLNPRNGDMQIIPSNNAPIVDLGWPNHAFGQANDTVYVYEQVEHALCWFDSDTLSWECHGTPADVPLDYAAFATITDDPINDRVILTNGIHGQWWSDATDDIWAVEPDTNRWMQLLAPSD